MADLGALEVDGENLVGSAGKDEDGGAAVVLRCLVDGKGGVGDVGDLGDDAAGDAVVFGVGEVDFGRGVGGFAGGGVGPEMEGEMAGRGLPCGFLREQGGRGGDEGGECEEAESHCFFP